jgi:hypothetical protein
MNKLQLKKSKTRDKMDPFVVENDCSVREF